MSSNFDHMHYRRAFKKSLWYEKQLILFQFFLFQNNNWRQFWFSFWSSSVWHNWFYNITATRRYGRRLRRRVHRDVGVVGQNVVRRDVTRQKLSSVASRRPVWEERQSLPQRDGKSLRNVLLELSQLLSAQQAGTDQCYKTFLARWLTANVTRFDKISLLWQNCTSIWYFFHSLFLMWQNVETTLANLLHCWANFHRFKWPNNVNIWSHCSDSMKHTL